MITEEELKRRFTECVIGLANGELGNINNIPSHYNYGHLIALFMGSNSLENGQELFSLFYKFVKYYSRNILQRKYANKEKIKVSFLAVSAVIWPSEKLYRFLENDDRFEVNVIGLKWVDKSEESSKETFEMLRDKFDNESYNFVSGLNPNGEFKKWDEIGIPDICIYLSPWWESLEECQSLSELPLSTVNIHIPYGIYIENNISGDYMVNFAYNKEFMNVMDTVFIDTEFNKKGFEKYSILHGENVCASGYAKMDFFYDDNNYTESDLKCMWKIPDGMDVNSVKKVIIAPHYTVEKNPLLGYSTFDKNYNFLYYLAKKNKNISFIFKPHPNLKYSAIKAGIFNSYEEYKEYLDKWNNLPNAKVVDEASYLELFDTSDALILDCISFMTEYIYVNKPVLFLTRKEQRRNELGEEIFKGLYKADGNDYTEIESFISERVIKGNDDMSDIRQDIYHKYLDYRSITGKLANELIYDSIVNIVTGN